MESPESLWFGPFRLGVAHEQLWQEDQPILLRPKTFAVLRYLATHAGQLVTQEELLDTVWAKTIVSDTVLRSCIRELRTALGDDARQPRYIATVHRRGYRFIGQVVSSQHSVVSSREESGVRRPKSEVKNSQSVIRNPPAPSVGGQSIIRNLSSRPSTTPIACSLAVRTASRNWLTNFSPKALLKPPSSARLLD